MSSTELVLSPEEEARHLEAESRIQNFSYRKPDSLGGYNKALVQLVKSDIMTGLIQVIEDGGENALHYHEGMDTLWLVIKGKAAFYGGPEEKLLGEYGPLEGLHMPRGARYWFAKEGDEDLELLQLSTFDLSAPVRRIQFKGADGAKNRNLWLDGTKGNAALDRSGEKHVSLKGADADKVRQGPPEEIEARHVEAESRIRNFSYSKPENIDGKKGIIRLCKSDILQGLVQVIKSGGENNLHYHEGMDSFWMVLKGRAAFYGPGDKLIGEYGPLEGLLMPRLARYWFAKASDDEDLELLQIIAYEDNIDNTKRINSSRRKLPAGSTPWFDAQNDNEMIGRPKV